MHLLQRDATTVPDSAADVPPLPSPDPDDGYLIALAFSQNAMLVLGDCDLLDLLGGAPILALGDLLDALGMRR